MGKVSYNSAGYVGSSMSRRAREAYENGEKPKSRWTKEAMLDALKRSMQEFLTKTESARESRGVWCGQRHRQRRQGSGPVRVKRKKSRQKRKGRKSSSFSASPKRMLPSGRGQTIQNKRSRRRGARASLTRADHPASGPERKHERTFRQIQYDRFSREKPTLDKKHVSRTEIFCVTL